MYSSFFDIDTTGGQQLNHAFTSYTEARLSEPETRSRIALDFPTLEFDSLTKVEEVLLHIYGRAGRTGDSDIEWIRVCGQEDRLEPINSTLRTQFLREDNPRLLLKTRFVNLNYGEGSCDETYIVGYRRRFNENPIIITQIHVKMDKTEVSCEHVSDLTRKDICHQNDTYAQSYELVIWKKGDAEYTR